MDIIKTIAEELSVKAWQVEAAVSHLEVYGLLNGQQRYSIL